MNELLKSPKMRETPTTLLAPAANEAINHNNSTTTTTTTKKKKKSKSEQEEEEEEAHQQEGEGEGEGEEVHPQPPPFPFVVGRSRSQAATRRVTPTTGAMSGTGTLTPTASSSSSSSATVEKLLPNGDLFKGSFSSNVPHGTGKYLWTDGCMYQGDWRRGKAWGKGKFSWPSGATYEGEFKSGRMDGFGTFTGSDGDTYRGSWSTDRKHGYGQKSYANGDFYQGLWKRNVQEGQGRYVWRNGNEYVGEWKNGFINGRGVLIWCNGNRYDGQWENGVPKGSGVFTWPDGSCYVGSWNNNNKYVINKNQQLDGTFYPPMPSHPLPRMRTPPLVVQQDSLLFTRKRSSTSSLDAAAAGASARGSLTERNFPRICIWESDGEAGDITCDIIDNVEASMFYRDGTDYDPLRAVGGGAVGSAPRPSPCCFAREAKKTGQTISKGHKNYDLMLNLQLGIRYSVGKHASNHRELRPVDFDPREKFWTRFPSEGSKVTPPHQSAEFRWKDYCPMVFRHLRDFFGIDPADYMLAICGNDALRELSSPGKSGSFFYLTQDDRFMIKTVKKSEVKVLLRMLPSYYQHVSQYENSLVTKFFGVHCVKPVGGQKTRFIVMGNLFCSEYRIHKRFDLKGSSHGRSTHKPDGEIDETTTLKDLDLNFVFRLQRSWFQELIRQIELDCEFLEAERIMDYSLLIGLHFRDDYSDEKIGLSPQVDSGKKDLRVKKGYQFLEVQLQDMNQILAGWKPVIRLGANMPARAEQVSRSELELYTDPTGGGEIFDVILYFGIIDILQDYDISKKLEHAYKSLQVDPTLISAVDPKLYSKRFRDFTGRIFVEDD